MSNMINSVTGTNFGSIKPSQKQQALETNYLNFANGSGNDFAQIHKATFPIAFPAWGLVII